MRSTSFLSRPSYLNNALALRNEKLAENTINTTTLFDLIYGERLSRSAMLLRIVPPLCDCDVHVAEEIRAP